MSAATAMLFWSLLYATVDGCERDQQKKQERVGRSVQRKIKEAVNQHSEASCERARSHPAPELILRLTTSKACSKQHDYEEEAKPHAYDACVRHRLQVIVVRLLKTIETVVRVVLSKGQPV